MTDNEIIKALKCCPQHRECCFCNSVEECGNKRILITSALDLINRQKSDVIREFVRKVKAHAYCIDFPIEHRVVDEDDIDRILKEMAGEE